MTVYAQDSKTGYSVELLEGAQFDKFWPNIDAMMRKVPHTWDRNMTPESVYARAKNNTLQVWAGGKQQKAQFVFFSQVAVHPVGNNLEVFWGCGEGGLEGGLDVIDAAMDVFARAHQCKEVMVIGRRGWVRRFAPWGFKEIGVVLSKPVPEKRMSS